MKSIVFNGIEYQYEVIKEGLLRRLIIKKGIVVFITFQFIGRNESNYELMATEFIKQAVSFENNQTISLY